MATKVIMPALGVTAEHGVVVRWLKQVGEAVEKEEALLEVETEKAVMEVPAPTSGILREILAEAGATVPVTEIIGWIDQPTAPASAEPASPAPGAAPEKVRASPAAKRVARELGIDLANVVGSGPVNRVLEEDVRGAAAGLPRERRQAITSVARRLALQHNVDLARLTGTGPGGRITSEDVLAAVAASTRPAPIASPTPVATEISSAEGELVPLGRVRRVTAERMARSAHSVAQVTLLMGVDMSEAVRFRKQVSPEFERRDGARLTYNAMIVKAAALALQEHRHFNARWEDGAIRLLPAINVGLAVEIDEGLVVPVIANADRRPLGALSREIERLIEKAHKGKLAADELTGGTFTVTNLGGFGVEAFAPIINPPEAAILGVGRIARSPVEIDGQVTIRERMYLTLAFDHRVADGAPAARFLSRIREILENPYVLVIEREA